MGAKVVNATKICYKAMLHSKRLWNKHCVLVIFQKILRLIILKKKTELKGSVIFFSVDFSHSDTNNVLYIHIYLMAGKYVWVN